MQQFDLTSGASRLVGFVLQRDVVPIDTTAVGPRKTVVLVFR
jgi:hypothetical protein